MIITSSANMASCVDGYLGISAVKRLNNKGESTVPWGTPACVRWGEDSLFSTLTLKVRPVI